MKVLSFKDTTARVDTHGNSFVQYKDAASHVVAVADVGSIVPYVDQGGFTCLPNNLFDSMGFTEVAGSTAESTATTS